MFPYSRGRVLLPTPAHCETLWRTVDVWEVGLNVPLHAITRNLTLFSPTKHSTFFTQLMVTWPYWL